MRDKLPIKRKRKTLETSVEVLFHPYGEGKIEVATGVGFLDHMLQLFGVHGGFDLRIRASGDLHVDYHHTVEDVGITLGEAFNEALSERKGIARYGEAVIPMEESLAAVYVDLARRPCFVKRGEIPVEKIGSFDTELVAEFLKAFALNGLFTLHVHFCYGENAHHLVEAGFKALGHAMRRALSLTGRGEALSSKGHL